jgi:hypothetical protein
MSASSPWNDSPRVSLKSPRSNISLPAVTWGPGKYLDPCESSCGDQVVGLLFVVVSATAGHKQFWRLW